MVASIPPESGFDMSGEPPEAVPCFLIMGNLMSSASWVVGVLSGLVNREWVEKSWPTMMMVAENLLSSNPTVISPRATGNPQIAVTVNGVALSDEYLARIISSQGLGMLAMYAMLVLSADERVAEFPIPEGLTLDGTAEVWEALVR